METEMCKISQMRKDLGIAIKDRIICSSINKNIEPEKEDVILENA